MNRAEITIRPPFTGILSEFAGGTAKVLIEDDYNWDEFHLDYAAVVAASEQGQAAILRLVCDHCGIDGFDILANSVRNESPVYLDQSRVPRELVAATLRMPLKMPLWQPNRTSRPDPRH